RFVTSPARLALLSRAPLVPAFAVRRTPWLADGRIVSHISPGMYLQSAPKQREAAIYDGSRRIIEQIENIVRQYPEQWLWMHRRWREEDTAAPDDETETRGAGEAIEPHGNA
ncbi:MAG: hypothetical protein M3347_00155, partial [Armatimonadota bacterium]|nr:hypothetical protein [Armatimonadota bacterium]